MADLSIAPAPLDEDQQALDARQSDGHVAAPRPTAAGLAFARAAATLVRSLLEGEVGRLRAGGVPVGTDEYRGLYVSPEEAARILAGPVEVRPPALDERALQPLLGFAHGRLGQLVRLARLSPAEAGAVLLAFATEVDLDLERLVSYVQDDVTKKRPRVELALRLFAGADGVASAPAIFGNTAPLRKFELIHLHTEPGQPETPLVARQVALDPRITAYLLGSDEPDERLLEHRRELPPPRPDGSIGLGAAFDAEIDALAGIPVSSLAVPVVAVVGADESSRVRVAARLAAGSGLGCLVLRFGRLAAQHGTDLALTLALREGALLGSAVVLEGADLTDREERYALHRRLREAPIAPLVVLSSAETANWPGLSIDVPILDFDGLLARWEECLPPGVAERPVLRTLAGKFRLSGDQVADAVEAAHGLALRRDPANPVPTIDDVYAAARAQSTTILTDLARKVPPHYNWDDLILPDEAKEQLREICAQMEHRATVLDEWGLGRRLAMTRGLAALFAGNSGTGKTMAAGVMAGALGLDLYKIDLSGIVSKYIGETEKNLAGIFREAETSNAILFFDEADALFGKRSEVKDAHDRYANIETAYLLQKVEEYAGIVILATNLKMNLDEAFLRRLDFVVDFPMPEEEDRLRIWKSMIPPQLPLAADVDFEFLARQFRLAGGNIRNIVLAAAYLGAEEGSEVAMRHFIRATRREYQKLGRMVTAADFGEHIALLQRTSG